MIGEGETIPAATFVVMTPAGPEITPAEKIFSGRRVALFGLPGAFTPVCHKEHLPGIVALYDNLRKFGIEVVACTAVNDIFVLHRWARDLGAQRKITMLADGNADFAMQTGLAVDLSEFGLGVRSNRYAMIVYDGKVASLAVEEMLSDHQKSAAAAVCETLEAQA